MKPTGGKEVVLRGALLTAVCLEFHGSRIELEGVTMDFKKAPHDGIKLRCLTASNPVETSQTNFVRGAMVGETVSSRLPRWSGNC